MQFSQVVLRNRVACNSELEETCSSQSVFDHSSCCCCCCCFFSLLIYIPPASPHLLTHAEILGALLSVWTIWLVTGVLVYLAVERLVSDDYTIEGTIMLITSGCAVLANIMWVKQSNLYGSFLFYSFLSRVPFWMLMISRWRGCRFGCADLLSYFCDFS